MKSLKWPALILIPLILAGLVFWERTDDDPPVSSEGASEAASSVSRGGLTWYCPVLDQDGLLELTNTTELEASARLLFFSSLFDPLNPPSSSSGENVEESAPYFTDTLEVRIPALSSAVYDLRGFFVSRVETATPQDVSRISRLLENSGVFISILVEFFEPGLIADSALCVNQTSDKWYLPFASTNRDACYYLAVFNPFTSSAVVDIDFSTDEGQRTPYAGKVIPPESSIIIDVGSRITRRDHISTEVSARSGRVVVAKYLVFTGKPDELERSCPSAPFEFEVRNQVKLWGSQILVGAPESSNEWFFPNGLSSVTAGSYTIYNTSAENSASVEVTITPNFGSDLNLSLTILPKQRQVVQLKEGELHPLPISPQPVLAPAFSSPGIGHWASFKSDTPIVVEKLRTGVQVIDGIAGGFGVARPATEIPIYTSQLNFGEESGLAFYGIANPLLETIAEVEISGVASGIEVGPGKLFILGIPRERLRGNEILTSSTPVVAAPLTN